MLSALSDAVKTTVNGLLGRFDMRTTSQRRADKAAEELIATLTRELTSANLMEVTGLREKDGVRSGSDNIVNNGPPQATRTHMLDTGITVSQHPAQDPYGLQRHLRAQGSTPWTVEFLVWGTSERQRKAIIQALNALIASPQQTYLVSVDFTYNQVRTFTVKVYTNIPYQHPEV